MTINSNKTAHLVPTPPCEDLAYFIAAAIGAFAETYNLNRQEACRYLSAFKGIDFAIENYEVEHQLSMEDCIEDMKIICNNNGGKIS